jgi:DNA-binding GntR family transcriptional regulator
VIHADSDHAEAARLLAVPIEHDIYFHIVRLRDEGKIPLMVCRAALSRLHEAIHNWLDDDETDPATE